MIDLDPVAMTEIGLLGGMVLEQDKIPGILAIIESGDFQDLSHREIYDAILRLHHRKEPIDLITIRNETPETVPNEKIFRIIDDPPLLQNPARYAEMVHENGERIRLGLVAESMANELLNGIPGNVDIDDIAGRIDTVKRKRITSTASHGIREISKKLETAFIGGYDTGYRSFPKDFNISPGTITIIAGRPGNGKTTFSYNLLLNIIRRYPKMKTLFVSYEESEPRLIVKMLVCYAGVQLSRINNQQAYADAIRSPSQYPENYAKIVSPMGEFDEIMKSGRLTVDDTGPDVVKLCAMLDAFKAKHGDDAGLVVVDYVQRIPNKEKTNATRQVQIQGVIDRIQRVATDMNLPVVLNAQLNRESTKVVANMGNAGYRYTPASYLRESGDIEQAADTVVTIQLSKERDEFGLFIVKNRGGSLTNPDSPIRLKFKPEILAITDKVPYEEASND